MDNVSETNFLEKIEEVIFPSVSVIPVEFFSNHSSKKINLVNNVDAENYQRGDSKWYDFSFDEALYVDKVLVYTKDYGAYRKLDFEFKGALLGDKKLVEKPSRENVYEFNVKDFIGAFKFKPEKVSSSSRRITKIEVLGFSFDDIELFSSSINRTERLKSDAKKSVDKVFNDAELCRQKIESFQDEKNTLKEEIAQVSEKKIAINSEVESLESKKEELSSKISQLRNDESELKGRVENLDDSIDEKQNVQKTLNAEISDKKAELRGLKEDINMFPSEISGFVNQGAQSVTKYLILSAIPLVIIFVVTFVLLSNAVDLTVIYKEEESFDIWSIMLTRIPFVVVALGVVHACYRVVKIFVSEIIKINQQRLNLSKISIIATDVSSASANDLGYSEDRLYQERIKMKMELLREHLKEYISSDYGYQIKADKRKPATESNEELSDDPDE